MKRIKYLIVFGIVCVISTIGIFTYSQYKSNNLFYANYNSMGLQMPDIEKTLQKIKITEVLVESTSSKKELVTMETELKEEVKWDSSFTDFDIFKKVQKLVFYGVGK